MRCGCGQPNCAISYPHDHPPQSWQVKLDAREYYTGGNKLTAIMVSGIITAMLCDFKLPGTVTITDIDGKEVFMERWMICKPLMIPSCPSLQIFVDTAIRIAVIFHSPGGNRSDSQPQREIT